MNKTQQTSGTNRDSAKRKKRSKTPEHPDTQDEHPNIEGESSGWHDSDNGWILQDRMP